MLEILQCACGDAVFQDCFAIRIEVFVAEQNVPPEHEADEHDEAALHFLARWNGTAAGTARVIFPKPGIAKITRVAVRKPARGLRIGVALMRHIEAAVPADAFVLDAQSQALRFYQGLGYQASGDEFTEAGIPHRRMRKGKHFFL